MFRIALLFALTGFLIGCSTSYHNRLQDLTFGMNQSEVRNELGSDYQVVGAKITADGQRIESWKYQDSEEDPAVFVYFVNGKLAQWGDATALANMPSLGEPTRSDK